MEVVAMDWEPAPNVIDFTRGGDLAGVRSLLAQRADVNATDPCGFTALHWAAHNGFLSLCLLLVESGADVAARTRFGATPLFSAQHAGQTAVVDFLNRLIP